MLAGVGLGFVLIVYGGLFRRESFSKTADDLVQAANYAKQHWEGTNVDAVIDEKIGDVRNFKGFQRAAIKVEPYDCPTPWDPLLWPTGGKRGEPPFYTVERLRGIAYRRSKDNLQLTRQKVLEEAPQPRCQRRNVFGGTPLHQRLESG